MGNGYLYCSVENGNDLSIDNDLDFRVKVRYDGWISWMPFLKLVTACSLDLTYFPLDKQTCSVVIINWMYGEAQVNFTIRRSPTENGSCTDTTNYMNSSDWEFVASDCGYVRSFSNVPIVWFGYTLRRVATYYVINIILPTICLSILSAMVFKMPPEAGEKMGLSVTVLMSYSVILMIMSDSVPRGNKLPIISKLIIIIILKQ